MSFSAGLWRSGYWPLQDVSFATGPNASFPLEVREARFAYRLVKRNEGEHGIGEWVPDYTSFGDVLGGFLWHQISDNERPIPAWEFAWPARSQVTPEGTGATEDFSFEHEVHGDLTFSEVQAIPIHRRDDPGANVITPKWKSQWTVDTRFAPLGVTFPEHWPKIPGDFHGIVLNATREALQTPLWMHTDPRAVSVNIDGDVKCGSFVVDLDIDSKVDPTRMASLQSHERVIKEPTELSTCPPIFPVDPDTGKKANSIAWVITKSKQGDVTGALVFGQGCGAPLLHSTQQDTFGPALALASCEHSGPLDVGSPGDQHRIGYDADGIPINALHNSTNTYFRMTDFFDGPLDFELTPYQEPDFLPQLTRVHLRFDASKKHPFLCGEKDGKWRWIAETQWGTSTGPDITIPLTGGGGGAGSSGSSAPSPNITIDLSGVGSGGPPPPPPSPPPPGPPPNGGPGGGSGGCPTCPSAIAVDPTTPAPGKG